MLDYASGTDAVLRRRLAFVLGRCTLIPSASRPIPRLGDVGQGARYAIKANIRDA